MLVNEIHFVYTNSLILDNYIFIYMYIIRQGLLVILGLEFIKLTVFYDIESYL